MFVLIHGECYTVEFRQFSALAPMQERMNVIMDTEAGSHCNGQYNVGVLDGVGVGILWMNVFRWAVLLTFNDDINILFCLRNPVVVNGSSNILVTIFKVITGFVPVASLIYTIVQAANCGEKPLSALIVFVSFYDIVFQLTRAGLKLNAVAMCCLPGPDLLLLILSAIAVGYGGQVRAIGIAGIVFVCILMCISCDSTTEVNGVIVKYVGPLVIFYGFVYPAILASFITIIVKDHDQ